MGKSTLLSTLAGVYSEVAEYEFTTLTTVPGCIKYKGAKIQVNHSGFIIYIFCTITLNCSLMLIFLILNIS